MGQWTSIGTGRTIRPALGTWSTSTGWGTKTCIAWRRRRATHSASTWKTGRTAPRTPSTTSFPWARNWTLFTGKLATSWRLAVTQERRVSTDVRHRHGGLAIVTLIRNQQESSRTSRNEKNFTIRATFGREFQTLVILEAEWSGKTSE